MEGVLKLAKKIPNLIFIYFLSQLVKWDFLLRLNRLFFEFPVKVPTYFANILYNQLRALHSRWLLRLAANCARFSNATQDRRNRGGQGKKCPLLQYFGDQLTLSQPGRHIMPTTQLHPPPPRFCVARGGQKFERGAPKDLAPKVQFKKLTFLLNIFLYRK